MINDLVSHRINALRTLMIFGVVILHTPLAVMVHDVPHEWFAYFKSFFQNAVFRTTVPVLTIISGYLLFKSTLVLNARKLYQQKAQSLGVPFLFFNLSLLVVVYFIQRITGVTYVADLISHDPSIWMDAAFAWRRTPVNYPLHFLRDLMVLILLAPVFNLFLRKAPFVGLILVSTIFLNNVDGFLILRNAMAVLFYAGGMIAVLKIDVLRMDKFAWPCLTIFILACLYVIQQRVSNLTYLALAAPFLIWPAASLLDNTKFGKFLETHSTFSFVVFLAHAPVLAGTWLIYNSYLSFVPYPIYWLLAPVVTVITVIFLFLVASQLLPSSFIERAIGCYKKPTGPKTEEDIFWENADKAVLRD